MTKRQERQAQRIAQAVADVLAPRLADLDRRICNLEARVGAVEERRT